MRRHSENGISHSENYFLNSESCSENSRNASRALRMAFSLRERFAEIDVVPRLLKVRFKGAFAFSEGALFTTRSTTTRERNQSAQKVEKIARFPAEKEAQNPVTSLAVMGFFWSRPLGASKRCWFHPKACGLGCMSYQHQPGGEPALHAGSS